MSAICPSCDAPLAKRTKAHSKWRPSARSLNTWLASVCFFCFFRVSHFAGLEVIHSRSDSSSSNWRDFQRAELFLFQVRVQQTDGAASREGRLQRRRRGQEKAVGACRRHHHDLPDMRSHCCFAVAPALSPTCGYDVINVCSIAQRCPCEARQPYTICPASLSSPI